MSKLSSLPPDVASTLRLLATGRSPRDVAQALAIEPDAVRERALVGADLLAGPKAEALAESERKRVLAFLFSEAEAEPLLDSSPAARDYAEAVRAGIDGEASVTSTPAAKPSPSPPTPAVPSTSKPPQQHSGASIPSKTPQPGPASAAPVPAGSNGNERTRGLILIGCLGVVVTAVVIAIISPWGNSSSTDVKSSPTTTAASSKWVVRDRFTLKAVDGGTGKALAGVETKGETAALLIAGNGMIPKSTIGIWLTGKGSSGLVGFQVVNSKGQFSAVGALPKNLQSADTLIVTRETAKPGQAVPKTPGPVLLSSPFTLS